MQPGTIPGTPSFTGVVDAAGTLTITIRPTAVIMWNISQVSIEMVAVDPLAPIPGGAACTLRRNGYLVTPLVPPADAAGGDPPILLTPSDVATVEWIGCTPGDIGRVLVIYTEIPYS